MDPFERFQDIKPQIEANAKVMQALRTYGFREPFDIRRSDALEWLGRGRHNVHFRIGKVGDLWLATREDMRDFYWEESRSICESYITQVVETHKQGHRVPQVCGAVLAHGAVIADGPRDRYFLLLEDLTRGGTSDFVPAPPSGELEGTLDGLPVFHDFDTLRTSGYDGRFPDEHWKFTKPDYLLHLREP